MPEEVVEKKEGKFSQMMGELGTFCYNSDEGTVMGRTGGSWAKITGFYIIFYSCLACFFGVCLHVALMTIPDDRPKLVGRSNRPTISPARKVFREIDFSKGLEAYQVAVGEFITEYDGINSNVTASNFSVMTIGDNNRYRDCWANDDNYVTGENAKGCLFLSINRRFDWVPAELDHIKCEWDVGLGGTGSLKPGFDHELIRPVVQGTYLASGNYYPWSSKAVNGEQPVWAIKISRKDNLTENVAEEAYLKCSILNGTTAYEDYAGYIFTILYTPEE